MLPVLYMVNLLVSTCPVAPARNKTRSPKPAGCIWSHIGSAPTLDVGFECKFCAFHHLCILAGDLNPVMKEPPAGSLSAQSSTPAQLDVAAAAAGAKGKRKLPKGLRRVLGKRKLSKGLSRVLRKRKLPKGLRRVLAKGPRSRHGARSGNRCGGAGA